VEDKSEWVFHVPVADGMFAVFLRKGSGHVIVDCRWRVGGVKSEDGDDGWWNMLCDMLMRWIDQCFHIYSSST